MVKIRWDREVDLLVAGAGPAGYRRGSHQRPLPRRVPPPDRH